MKKLINILYRKITISFVISTLSTFIFAVGLKFIFGYFYDISPVRGGLTEMDISYFGIIILFRFIFSTLIEFITEEKLNMPIGGTGKELNITTLMMDDNSAKSSTKSSNTTKSSTQSSNSTKSSTQSSNSTKSSTQSSNSKMFTIDQMIEMQEEFTANYTLQYDMIRKLRELKDKEDIKYFVDKEGNLDMTVPNTMTEKESIDIAKKVGIMDRIINTKVAEMKKLEGKDLMSNNSETTNSYAKLKEFTKEQYEKLFK